VVTKSVFVARFGEVPVSSVSLVRVDRARNDQLSEGYLKRRVRESTELLPRFGS
jgi:hypothetical protein